MSRRRNPSPTWSRHFTPRSVEEIEYILRYTPSLAPQLDDIARRLAAAGAAAPWTYLGVGGSGLVVCDARGIGFKAGRWPGLPSVADEAEWFRIANQVPGVREHVARLRRYHADLDVIERECVRPKQADKVRRWKTEGDLWDLHRAIERAMLPYGWNAPELKADSYVLTRDRGYVLVDGGMAARVGSRLARHLAEAHRDPRRRPDDLALDRFALRNEYDLTIPRAVGERLEKRLAAARPNPRRHNPAAVDPALSAHMAVDAIRAERPSDPTHASAAPGRSRSSSRRFAWEPSIASR